MVVVDAGADDDGPAAAGRFEEPLPGDLVEGALDRDEARAVLGRELPLGGEELSGPEVAADALEEPLLDLGVEGRARPALEDGHALKSISLYF